MNFKIGDIVYILNPDPVKANQVLIPAKIEEQIITRNFNGEDVKHIVNLPDGKSYTLEKITDNVFSNLDDAKVYMMNQASQMISRVIDSCRSHASSAFGSIEETIDLGQEEFTKPDTDKVVIELPNGSKANVTIPEILLN